MKNNIEVIPQNTPIENKQELISYLKQGCKNREDWRIGTEHEKFGFCKTNLTPLPYKGECSIESLLKLMQEYFSWQPIMEGENIIGLQSPTNCGASISLEPGGQLELSGAPLSNIHETCKEVHSHLKQVKEVSDEIGLGFLGVGFSPKWSLEETPIMPKARYSIMREYMPTRGNHGRDMMFRSCTVQVNLDFSSESDMVDKMRIGLALQPIVTAIFANSPFIEGKPNGYLSYRSEIWKDTDPDRTGILPFVFNNDMSFEKYVDYALSVPMYFVYRNGQYINVAGKSFHDFLKGKLLEIPGEIPTIADWENHLTTIFPEVRLKRFIEMRGADGGPWRRLCALPALWVGLLYDEQAMNLALELISDWQVTEIQEIRNGVPKLGLNTLFRGKPIKEIADKLLDVSILGLNNRDICDSSGKNEAYFLQTINEIISTGKTPAEELLRIYHDKWSNNIDCIFHECAY